MKDKTQRYNYAFTWNCPDSVEEESFVSLVNDYIYKDMKDDCSDTDTEKAFTEFQMQLEKGEEEGRLHLQGRFSLRTKRTKSTMLEYFRCLLQYYVCDEGTPLDEDMGLDLYENLTIRPEVSKLASKAYVTKEDTRLEGTAPFCYPPLPPRYSGKDIEIVGRSPREWQRRMLSIIDSDPDDRRVYWLYDSIGNTGKSKFFKWIQFNRKGEVGEISDAGTASQLKQSSYNLGPKRVYICDLPRVKGDNLSDIFRTIETIKNGKLLSTMYGGSEPILFDPPHVFICSNFLPDMRNLSSDRWVIYEITQDFDLKDITFSLKNAINNIQSSHK